MGVAEVKTAVQHCTDMALDLIPRKPKCQASYGLSAFTDSSFITELPVAATSFLSAFSRVWCHVFSA